MKLHTKVLGVVGLGLLLAGTNLVAAEKSATDIISNSYKYLGSMDKYAFSAVVSIGEYKQNISAKVSRPNMLRVDTNGDIKNRSNYFNNGLYTMMDHDTGFYGQIETPKSIDATLDVIFTKFGIKSPMATFFHSDMDQRMKLKNGKYFGTVNVAGVECDYVAFRNKTRVIHAWIATGDTPLVKTYSVIEQDNSRMNTTLTWTTNANISENDFVFKAPENASKITVNSAN